MRELKFRIWMNGRYNENDEWIHIDTNGKVCMPQCCNEDCGPEDDQSSYVIEQYTGLKDKNGKEIYEGDILKVEWANDHVNFQVEWSKYLYGFCIKSKKHLYDFTQRLSETSEIIGNIYENPELLEKL